MHRSAKPSRQCPEASKKANLTLGMIRRAIVTRDKDTILRLYKTLVRPQLEYCIQVWSPYLKQDMEKLEKVQRRATKMIQGYKYLSYEERLIRCGLTLEKKRSRGDLIEAYKIITGKELIHWERFFEIEPSKVTRGHRYKLFKKTKGTLGQTFFSARVVDLWNEFDDSIIVFSIYFSIYRLPRTSLPVSTPNTIHHSRLTVCLPDSLDLDRCLMILFWLISKRL